MNMLICAIRDTLSMTIVGGLQVFPHPAPAVRFFGDVCKDAQTNVARHVGDHELIHLANLIQTDDGVTRIDGFDTPTVLITGDQWSAAQAPAE